MSRHTHSLARLFVVVIVLISAASAMSPASLQTGGKVEDLRRARQRWSQLSAPERERVRENYRRYQALSESERSALREQSQHMKRTRERLMRELDPDMRREFMALEPERRRQALQVLLEAEASEVGQRVRSKMPRDVLAEIERAQPGERAELLLSFKKQQRGRVARGAIESLGRRLGLPEAEVRRRQDLPAAERAENVLEMRREVVEKKVQDSGLPHGLTWEQWEVWSELPPEQFFEQMMKFREQRMREKGEQARRRPAGAPGDGRAARGVRGDEPLSRVLRRLSEAVRPNPRDALELMELSRPARKRAMVERRRQRCMELLQNERVLPATRVAELERIDDDAFFDFVRQVLRYSGYVGPG